MNKPYYRWFIFAILGFGYILVYFHRLCPAVLAVDMMRDLRTQGTLLGVLGSAYFYPYAAMQLPAGLLSDSWGPRRTITLFLCIAVVGTVVMGAAQSVWMAIIGRTLVGLGVSMLFVSTLKILAVWFDKSEFPLMTGILMALGGIGSLSAQAPLVRLSRLIGWRMSLIVVGLFTALIALLVGAFVRDRPAGSNNNGGDDPGHSEQIGLAEGARRVLCTLRFWPIAIWFFLTCGIFFSFAGLWGGPYLVHVYGMTKSQAGDILSMLAIGMIVGSPVVSYLSDRVMKSRKLPLICSSVIMFVLMLLLFAKTDSLTPIHLYLICLGIGVFSSAIVVVAFTANKELFPVQIAGTSTGLVNLFPFTGGAVFQPLLGSIIQRQGQIGDAFTVAGYRNAFLALIVAAVGALVASLFIKETYDRQ